jgi:hypothetical protein
MLTVVNSVVLDQAEDGCYSAETAHCTDWCDLQREGCEQFLLQMPLGRAGASTTLMLL